MKNTYVLINPPGLGKYSKIASDDCLGLGYINASLQSEFNGYIINCTHIASLIHMLIVL